MIKLGEILKFGKDIRFKRVSDLLEKDYPAIYSKIKDYRDEFYCLWDILYYGENVFRLILSKEEFDILVEKLAEYGLKFGDPIANANAETSGAMLQTELQKRGLEALNDCSIVDFVEGSDAMKIINTQVIRYIEEISTNEIDLAVDDRTIEKAGDNVCWMLDDYRKIVFGFRSKLYSQISPEDGIELKKITSKQSIRAKLGEIKNFHHKQKSASERVHFYNPYNTEDGFMF